ncbi:unnamed protein product [Urochloa humidicola]
MEEIAKVDLHGLNPGTPGWAEARAAVTASMAAHGCVVAAHDAVDEKLRRALFGRALPELFTLPFDAKKRSGVFVNGPHTGYVGQVPNVALETVAVPDAADDPGTTVRDLAGRLWPDDGNPDFCETMVAFAKNVLELEQMVERMVLEGLGACEESIATQLASQSHAVRVTLYGAPWPGEEASGVALLAHRDEHMTTVIAQDEVGGLEVAQGARDGARWFAVPPEPGTLVFMAGDQFTVVTNGRVPACMHRVRTPAAGSGRGRFSALLFRRRREGGDPMLRAMEELVDEEHPLMYKPCNHEEYRAFRFSEEGRRLRERNPLKAFCGVVVEKLGGSSMEC